MANVGIFPSIFMANSWEVFHLFFYWNYNAITTLKRKMLIFLLCMIFWKEFLASVCLINLNIGVPLRISSLSLRFCNSTLISHICISPVSNVLPVWLMSLFLFEFFKILTQGNFFIVFRDIVKERERERERNIHVKKKCRLVAFLYAPWRDGTHNPCMYLNLGLNPWPFGLWDDAPTN